MIPRPLKYRILSLVDNCKDATENDRVRIANACDGKAVTDFEHGRKILKTPDVADMLGLSLQSVRNLVNTGLLTPYKKPGNKQWSGIMRDSVDAYVERLAHSTNRKARR